MLFLLAALLALITFSLAAPQAQSLTSTATSTSILPTATTSGSPVPTTNCVSDNFISPWVINNVVIVSPPPGSNAYPTYISFNFDDPNQDLELNTYCGGAVNQDGDMELANGGYVGCDNSAVRFQLQDDESILISRWYKDLCKGDPPYDSGIAYGQSDADFRLISNEAGSMKFQQRMEMDVTRMS